MPAPGDGANNDGTDGASNSNSAAEAAMAMADTEAAVGNPGDATDAGSLDGAARDALAMADVENEAATEAARQAAVAMAQTEFEVSLNFRDKRGRYHDCLDELETLPPVIQMQKMDDFLTTLDFEEQSQLGRMMGERSEARAAALKGLDFDDAKDFALKNLSSIIQSVADRIAKGGVSGQVARPVVLDLDGDGIELVARDASTVFFDTDGDGFKEHTACRRHYCRLRQ